MGVVRDIVKTVDQTSAVTGEVKETLGILMKLAEAKGKVFEETIKEDLITGKTWDNLTISITKNTGQRIEYRAVTSIGTTKIIDEIKTSMSNLFSGDGKILEGIAGILSTALTAIMGAGEGEESEVRSYMVVPDYPSIVRYDFAFWGRNIRAQSIKQYMENVFTCVAYRSAVDMSKLQFNDFLSLYTPVLRKAFGDDQSKLKEMIMQAKEIYELFSGGKKTLSNFNVNSMVNAIVQDSLTKPLFKITSQLATEGTF